MTPSQGPAFLDPYEYGPVHLFGTQNGGSGKFSSDRTITEYAADIWGVKPCPVR
ncbi:MAG: glycogen/starch/alpha-glucan phosphorylase [Acidobacteriia bacterium]|nr:glycogen/starch/alpha-glucan phosphorylase [Terriglobia bacterium]MBV9742529.1 glycogen/starch/alpha-glucan phosphorylase [Terriglobia bacterium]